ncbi:MAG: hypothetical protein WKF41_00075 [Gaiellaceae bacterium]
MMLRPILVLLAALALAGCGAGDSDVQPSATAAGTTVETGAEAETPAANGSPDISGSGLDGEALSIADFRGKPVFVNVWSSW